MKSKNLPGNTPSLPGKIWVRNMNAAKHIGILAITAEGAALCYRTIVSESAKMMGINKHPEISLHSYSFDEILKLQLKEDWNSIADILLTSIQKVIQTGAEFVIIPANSIHFALELIAKRSPVPVLSILDVVVQECQNLGWKKTLVLGVGQTMRLGLYNNSLHEAGIQPVVPDRQEQELINTIIYNEIVPFQINKLSTNKIISIIQKYKDEGCDGVVLGCTELPLILDETNCPLSFIDTTRLLAVKAAEYATA